ncbi:MAG: hypothetical protein ACJ74O_05925 [Frankiaceae bacterium]
MTTGEMDPFATARTVADTVLLEGYVLYPYRASAAKNRMRWQFGVLMPAPCAARHAEATASRTECLVDLADEAVLRVRLRFLHLVRRTVEAAQDGGFAPVDRFEVGDAAHVPWDEGETEEVDLEVALADLIAAPVEREVGIAGSRACEPLRHPAGRLVGRLVREALPLRLRLAVSAQSLPGPYGALRLRVDVENRTEAPDPGAPREEALRSSLVAAHSLLALSRGSFLSLAAPPEWARPAAAGCTNEGTWPVLVGGRESARVVLSSPIILDDDPAIAPESGTVLYDSTEIDEILTLRTMTLTDEEKREARGTDPRAAAVVDAVDGIPPELLDRLHGAIRSLRAVPAIDRVTSAVPDQPPVPRIEASPPLVPWWDPGADDSVDPERDSVLVGGVPVARGAHVLLRPGTRGADAQDMFLAGRSATVEAVLHDVDGCVHVAVSIDDDPLAEVQAAHGRYRYFRPDELEPLERAP